MAVNNSGTYEELFQIIQALPQLILKKMTEDEKRFLISIKQGKPDWSLFPIPGIEKLPAILWKLQNIKKIPEGKKEDYLLTLRKIFNL